ncbi:DNA poymerase III subunit delta' [hydrothermal vent metagenome]|uniref:DNA poymerase III subunit delta n=1 Tax=hydrothermal vent metagenome TaxID=652676 RepID=A0A1W1B8J1_9ZZZZ
MKLSSQVIITQNIGETLIELERARVDENIVEIVTPQVSKEISDIRVEDVASLIHRSVTERESFRLVDAKLAIEKAYMASDVESIIILASNRFSTEVQNKLLKVIEEPPPHVSFILVTSSKAAILPTIRSRLPITTLKNRRELEGFELNVRELDLASVYDYIQKQKRTSGSDMKSIVERISIEAIGSQKFELDEATLQLFHDSYRALDLGSPPQFVLTTLLLKLLAKKRR